MTRTRLRSRRRRWLRRLTHRLAGWLAPLVAGLWRAVAATWRVRIEGDDPLRTQPPSARLGALWHHNLIAAAGVYRDSGIHVPVSRSQDGDIAVAVMQHLGLGEPPRGSSAQGAVSLLRGLVRLVRAGQLVAVLPDGPVGPARVCKPGVIEVARQSGEPIVPVAIGARPSLRLPSWDRPLLPLPFARVVCRYGEPLRVPTELDGGRREELRAELDRRLEALGAALEAELRGAAGAAPAEAGERIEKA